MRLDQAAGFLDDESTLIGVATRFAVAEMPPLHHHRRAQIAYSPDTAINVLAGGRHHVLTPGEAILLPPALPHRIWARTPRIAQNLYLDPASAPRAPDAKALAVAPLERELIAVMAAASASDRADRAFANLLAVFLDRLRPAESPAFPAPVDPALRRIHEAWLDDPAALDTPIDVWADRLALTRRTLQRRIARETGLSYRDWQRRTRLTAAVGPLLMDAPVKHVAAEAGYRSASAFVAAFRATFGVTPGRLADRLR
ncbi:helix-turn-helix transcriptional regulator [Acuticoccus kandeliae]|uniref:helix-turn-helix transcriptional regulator n=1 Tax=Acuticoccus kandeliae TaxID=2073160 RepID=UPI0014750105|nr:AraC family transcriptional regulator [Acuticoccus kandeliae]